MSSRSAAQNQGYVYFLNEAPELLQTIEQELFTVREGSRLQKVHTLMRATHTLKGAAANVGLETIKTIAHSLEDAFKALYNQDIELDDELERLLFEGYECLRIPLTTELAGVEVNDGEVLDRAASVFAELEDKLGDYRNQGDYIPTSAELGFDIAQSIFELGVQQRLDNIERTLNETPDRVGESLRAEAEVFVGLAESLNLQGFGAIAQATLTALDTHPHRARDIAKVALADFRDGQARVLNGDRDRGGTPSEGLQQFASGETLETEDVNRVESLLVEFDTFLSCDRYGKPVKSDVRQFFLDAVFYVFQWFQHHQGIGESALSFDLLIEKPRQFQHKPVAISSVKAAEYWVDLFLDFLDSENEGENVYCYRKWMLLSTVLAVAKLQYADDTGDPGRYRDIPAVKALRHRINRVAEAYKQRPPVSPEQRHWLELPQVRDRLVPAPEDEDANALFSEIWETPDELEEEDAPTEPEPSAPSEARIAEVVEPDPPASPKPQQPEPAAPATQSKTTADSRQLVPVDIKGIERLNQRLGELLVEQNRKSLDDAKVYGGIVQLRSQLARHQETMDRLLDWSDRIALLLERQAKTKSHRDPSLALGDFDPLELEDYDNLHGLLRSALDETNQLDFTSEAMERLAKESARVMEKQQQLLSRMQDDLIEVRMLPVGDILQRFPAMVQQLARMQDKPAELTLKGTDILIEQAIAQKLYDLLLHLVRNAFDHGIESSEVRQQQGKPPTGQIEIHAYYQGTQTIIDVKDDGKGLDIEWIRRRAIELEFLSSEQANQLVAEELLEVLFEPGFSTASQISELSGRGVGLDVVRSQLHSLKGNITVQTQPQQGTTFSVRIPLTLTIAKLLVVQAGRDTYALLSDAIEKIVLPSGDRVKLFEGQKVLNWGEGEGKAMVPVRQLADVLGMGKGVVSTPSPGWQAEDETPELLAPISASQSGLATQSLPLSGKDVAPVLLLQRNGRRLALEIDQILGEQELVIRPLGSAIAPPPYIIGCTILSNTRLTLVLDGATLIDRAEDRPRHQLPESTYTLSGTRRASLPQSSESRSLPKVVLAVDDSQSLRQTLVLTLQKAGYQVREANDGREALDRLRQNPDIDLVVCDLEMPRMNGFEVLSHCRQDPSLAEIPIVTLTSHTSDQYRQLATELGAAAYLNKPYSEPEFLALLSNLVRQK